VQKLSGAVFCTYTRRIAKIGNGSNPLIRGCHRSKKSARIDIIIEKAKKQIRIPEGMTLSAGLTHYQRIIFQQVLLK